MEISIANTLRSPHQIFILNYFQSWISHPDWTLIRSEIPFQENGYRMTQNLWRSSSDRGKAISVNLNENPSPEACLANLDVTAAASAGRQVEAGEVQNPERGALLRTIGARVLVDYEEVHGEEMNVSRVNYHIGNIGVEIQSVGSTPCNLEEIRDLAINFFLIPSISKGEIKVVNDPQFSVEADQESSRVTVDELSLNCWYMLVVGQDDCHISRSQGLLRIKPGSKPLQGVPIFLLSADRKSNKIISGPLIHP